MKLIECTKGQTVQVDDGDYEWLNKIKWSATKRGYAYNYDLLLAMHRLIMGDPQDFDVDHIDGDKLNNQRQSQIHARTKSYYLGIYPTPEDAARAWDAKAKEIHGEFARLNFPTIDVKV